MDTGDHGRTPPRSLKHWHAGPLALSGALYGTPGYEWWSDRGDFMVWRDPSTGEWASSWPGRGSRGAATGSKAHVIRECRRFYKRRDQLERKRAREGGIRYRKASERWAR